MGVSNGAVEDFEIALALSQLSLAYFSAFALDPEACSCNFFCPRQEFDVGTVVRSEEVDVISIEAGDLEDLPLLSPGYEDL